MGKKLATSRWTYVKYALAHPWHVVVLAGATVFGVANWNIWVLLAVFAIAQIVLLAFVLHLKAFRQYVDEREELIAHGKAAEARTALLLQLRDEDRREYFRLETRLTGLETRLANFPAVSSVVNVECKELLKEFLQLSIQLALATASASEDWSINHKLSELASEITKNSNPLIAQRFERLNQHAVWKNENKKIIRDMVHHQAAIADTINIIIDRTVMPVSNTKYRLPSNLEGDLVSGQEMMSEMKDFVHIEDIDMDEFMDGRSR